MSPTSAQVLTEQYTQSAVSVNRKHTHRCDAQYHIPDQDAVPGSQGLGQYRWVSSGQFSTGT